MLIKIARWGFCFFVAVSLLLPPLVAPIWARYGVEGFKENFRSSAAFGTVKVSDLWAMDVAGSFGLNHLEELSGDASLKPSGRRVARELHDSILKGEHLPYFKEVLGNIWYVWPLNCILAYVYLADSWSPAPNGAVKKRPASNS